MRAQHLVAIVLACFLAPVPAARAKAPPSAGAEDPTARRSRAFLLYVRAREAAAEGRQDEARRLLERVLELDADAAPVHAALGRTCLAAGDLACAEDEAKRAVELDPACVDGHKVLAEIELGRWQRTRDRAALDRGLEHLARATDANPLDTAAWIARIRILAADGRMEEAERVAREASSIPGLDAAAPWMALARTLLARGRVDDAIALLERSGLTGRAAIPVLETLADLKGNRGDLAGQEEILLRLRELRPEDPELLHRIGLVRLERGDHTGALEPLRKAQQLRPGDPMIRRDLARALVRLGRGDEALPLLEGLPAAYRSRRTLLTWVFAAEQAGRYDLAAERLRELEEKLDDDERASFGQALALQRARDLLEAGRPEEAAEAIRDLPDDPAVVRLRVRILEALGRDDEAAQLLSRLREKDPRNPAWLALETILAADSKKDEGGAEGAVARALAAVRAAGDEAPALGSQVAMWLLAWDHGPLAARFLDALGLPANPPVELLRARAAVLMSVGRTGEAEAAYRMLLERSPDDDAVLNDLGYLLADEGRDLDEALAMIRRAVESEPENPNYLDSLAWVLHRLGRSGEALPLLLRAIRSGEGAPDATLHEHLGDVYLALGQVDRALAEWRAALALGSERRQELEEKIRRWEEREAKPASSR